jgi:hypothetical protein
MKENNNENEILETITFIKDLGMMYPKEDSKQKRHYGLYKCGLCGNEFRTQINNVKNGNTKSCGCYTKKHGLKNTRLYRIWRGIKDRTLNIKTRQFPDYGGRGITICEEWKNDFMSFHDWAMSNGYEEELSIDRIDNDGNYEPSNCRWTTSTIQNRNQRIRKNNTSGYRGVSFVKSRNKYVTFICVNNKNKKLGYFKTAIEAGIAYNNYIIENNLEGFILNDINLTQEM